MPGLCGRHRELEAVGRALGRADVGAVLLVGAPGIGKTRLLLEAGALGAAAGFTTERVVATRAGSTIPFGAVAQLLPASRTAAPERADLLRQAAIHLRERAGDRPLLLLVDDVHLLDDASATLVHQLVSSGTAFLVATQRADVDAPDSITALWKDEIAERLEVGPLTVGDVGAMVGQLLDGPAEPDLVHQLATAAAGNPLYVVQLLEGARRAGVVRQSGAGWALDGPLPLPDGLVAAVEERLAELGGDDRRLLELVALGEPLDVEVLEELAGADGAGRLEDLERTGLLLAESAGPRLLVRLAHPLYAEVLRDRAPTSSRRRSQLALADAVERRGPVGDDPLRVAGWRLAAGGTVEPALAIEASHEARRRGDFDLAARLGQAAADAGGGYEAHLAVALAKVNAAEPSGLLAALDEAWAVATDDEQKAKAAGLRFDSLAYFSSDYVGAFAVAAEARAAIDDPAWSSVLAARRAYLLVLSALPGALDAADDELAPYLDGVASSGWPLIWVSVAASWACWFRGRVAEGLAHAARGRAEVVRVGWTPGLPELSAFAFVEAQLVAFDGRVEEARNLAEAALAECAAAWSTQSVAQMSWCLALIEDQAGHLDDAAAHADRAAAGYRAPAFAASARTEQALALTQLGRVAEARAAIEGLAGASVSRGQVRLVHAWLAAAEGDLAAAVAALVDLAAGEGVVMTPLRVVALTSLARLGAPAAAIAPLDAIAAATGSPLPALLASHARAHASRRPAELLAAAEALEAAGLDLLAAETAAAAEAGFRAEGRPAPADAAAALRTTALARCGDAATPGLRTAAAGSTLTRRELEVAALAASGLGNREVAERLGTSKRTVDSQLRRVYLKLGIAGRSELDAALGGER